MTDIEKQKLFEAASNLFDISNNKYLTDAERLEMRNVYKGATIMLQVVGLLDDFKKQNPQCK